MNATLKALIVWLMLLAVPVQGFAAVTMLWCGPPSAGGLHQRADQDSGRALPLMAHASLADHELAAASGADTARHLDQKSQPHHHADAKCNACAACCIGVSIVPSFASSLAVQAPLFEFIPFVTRHLASADIALLERPPRA